MTLKHLFVPWTFGGAVLLGYASFAWWRKKRGNSPQLERAGAASTRYERVPLSDRLERVPEALALSAEREPELPANNNATPQGAELGALFLGRAAAALSPFSHPWPSRPAVSR